MPEVEIGAVKESRYSLRSLWNKDTNPRAATDLCQGSRPSQTLEQLKQRWSGGVRSRRLNLNFSTVGLAQTGLNFAVQLLSERP